MALKIAKSIVPATNPSQLYVVQAKSALKPVDVYNIWTVIGINTQLVHSLVEQCTKQRRKNKKERKKNKTNDSSGSMPATNTN